MKTFSLLAATLLLAVACNNNETSNEEEQVQTNTPQGTEQVAPIDPASVNNPMTAENPQADSDELPELTFEKETYEFPGKIEEGERVSYNFKFKNTGKADLIIASANASCGCTIPSFSKEPIPPGGSGSIKVEYNSENRGGGRHEKAVTVVSNAIPKAKELRIIVNVNPKPTN